MKLPELSRKQWIVLSCLLVLLITNPSAQTFKDHIGNRSQYGIRREYNLFICSVYANFGSTYVGVLGNFFKIG
ncbi:hypothetical protein [Mucilaginibacter sp. R-33]|uniref:hypothetical protein n=1 Tax=Mucilaginibacter sp. R-33 TaxID=3416711 RepID=UPI003CF6B618